MSLLLHVPENSLLKTQSEKKANSNQSVMPSPDAVSQWSVKAQQDLAHYEETGKLPEGMFLFD